EIEVAHLDAGLAVCDEVGVCQCRQTAAEQQGGRQWVVGFHGFSVSCRERAAAIAAAWQSAFLNDVVVVCAERGAILQSVVRLRPTRKNRGAAIGKFIGAQKTSGIQPATPEAARVLMIRPE